MSRICKRHKSKVGFTLVEMILVIAVIIILASALMVGVKEWIDKTNAANNSVAAESDKVKQQVQDDEASLAHYKF